MSRTPDIRFKGFSGDWEITSLSKLSSLITKGTTPLDKRNIGPINFIKIEDIDSTNGKITPKSTISEKEHNGYLRRSQLKENDILFSIAGTLGRVTSIPAAILPANTNQALAIIRTNKGNLKYIVSALKGPVVDNYLRENPTIGAQPNLSLTQVSALEIPFPSDSEQQDIGRFFFILEKLISDSQSEVDRLRNLKKAMLLKMFPQKGSKVPEIRFKGFSGDWETKPFKSIAARVTDFDSDARLPHVEYEDLNTGEGTLNKDLSKKECNKKGLVFDKGDVLYGKLRPYLHNWLLPTFKGIAVGDFWVLRPVETDAGFLYCLIRTADYDTVANQSSGTKMPRADWKLVSATEFQIPKSIDEQRLIGQYFQNLDSLIEQRQSNTDRLRHLKQAMLQRMFI